MSDIYAVGAARLWGEPESASGLGAGSQEVGMLARQLTDEALAAEAQVAANVSRIPLAQRQVFAHWMDSWSDFCRNVSGQRGTLQTIFDITTGRYLVESFLIRWRAAAIYNQVVEYRRKFNAIWEMISKSLGAPLTPFKPGVVPEPLSEDSFGMSVFKKVAVVGAVVGGGYLLLKWLLPTKPQHVIVEHEEE